MEERQCRRCGRAFVPRPSQIKSGYGYFCSQRCGRYGHYFKSRLSIVPVTIGGRHAIVHLTRDRQCIIDAADWPIVADKIWMALRCDKHWYVGHGGNAGRKGKFILMHRLLADAKVGDFVDHRNGNGLDNRRANLRICTQSQNQCNKPASCGSTSKFKGVSWNSARSRWVVQIKQYGKTYFLGRFGNEIDAAKAYDAEAIRLHGEFARLNFAIEGKPSKKLIKTDTRYVRKLS